jgi:hypothetical protein
MTEPRPGEPTPWFNAPTPRNPNYSFASVAGRYILLAFVPWDLGLRQQAFGVISRNIDLFNDNHIACFVVLHDEETFTRARDRDGMRWFFDPDGQVASLYGAVDADGAERPRWVVIDPSLRILFIAPLEETEALFARLRALPPPAEHAGTPLHAPVMLIPRLFDPDLCRRLVAYYDARGGTPSGVMREHDGKTIGVLDDFKKRRDVLIEDLSLQDETRLALKHRLLPEVLKAFRFTATHVERYLVACYSAEDGGYFRPHRDNLTSGTAHREFAVSINLNAEDYEGGDLRFPEYGMQTYRPPTGGAVVFSCSLLHEATSVTRGKRYAFLPFLYADAGEALRAQNEHLVVQKPEGEAAEALQMTDQPADQPA